MLTYLDEPTVRNAVMKRLGKEPGVDIVDIKIANQPYTKPPHIQVGIWWVLRDKVQDAGLIDGKSFFDLPSSFEHQHLLNEIDEIAEQIKVARKESAVGRIFFAPGKLQPRMAVSGTGLRGRWQETTN